MSEPFEQRLPEAQRGPFLRHVQARQNLMRTVLMLAAQECGGAEQVSYCELETAAAELTEAAAQRAAAIEAEDALNRFQPTVEVVHIGDADVGTGGEKMGSG